METAPREEPEVPVWPRRKLANLCRRLLRAIEDDEDKNQIGRLAWKLWMEITRARNGGRL